MSNFSVALIYLITLLAASRWDALGSLMNLLIILTAYAILGQLLHKYLSDPTICLNNVGSTSSSSSLITSFKLFSSGDDDELQLTILNLFNISDSYFIWCMTIPSEISVNSMLRKYVSLPKFVISNSSSFGIWMLRSHSHHYQLQSSHQHINKWVFDYLLFLSSHRHHTQTCILQILVAQGSCQSSYSMLLVLVLVHKELCVIYTPYLPSLWFWNMMDVLHILLHLVDHSRKQILHLDDKYFNFFHKLWQLSIS